MQPYNMSGQREGQQKQVSNLFLLYLQPTQREEVEWTENLEAWWYRFEFQSGLLRGWVTLGKLLNSLILNFLLGYSKVRNNNNNYSTEMWRLEKICLYHTHTHTHTHTSMCFYWIRISCCHSLCYCLSKLVCLGSLPPVQACHVPLPVTFWRPLLIP